MMDNVTYFENVISLIEISDDLKLCYSLLLLWKHLTLGIITSFAEFRKWIKVAKEISSSIAMKQETRESLRSLLTGFKWR